MARSDRSVLAWLLGEEGSVATEPGMQVVMAASAAVISGLYLVSPIVSALTGPFGASEAAVGQLITAYTAPPIVFVPVFGILADRVGRRPILAFGLLAFGLGGAAIALVPSFEVALALRVVQGIGYAAVNPISVAILGDLYGGSRETTAQGLRNTSITLTGLVVPPIAGGLVLAGWQYPFLCYLLAVPIAGWAWVALPATRAEEPSSIRTYVGDLRSALARPAIGAIVLSFAARFTMTFGLLAYISVLLVGLGASSVEVGVIVGLIGLVSTVASTQAGRIADLVDPLVGLFLGFVAIAAGMLVMGLASSLAVVVAGIVCFALGGGVSGPLQKSLVTRLSAADVRAGTVSSAIVFQSVGAAGGPFLMGVTLGYADVGWTFVLFGTTFGLAGVLLTAVAHVTGGRPPDAPA